MNPAPAARDPHHQLETLAGTWNAHGKPSGNGRETVRRPGTGRWTVPASIACVIGTRASAEWSIEWFAYHAEATGLFEKAYARYREDPWPLLTVMNKTFLIVADIASRDPVLADRLEKALAQPFAVLLLNEERLQTRYKVATYLPSSRLEDAVLALEPHVPWRKGLLARRAKLYEATRNPRAELAQREHDRYLKKESEDRRSPTSRPGAPAGEPEPGEPGNNTSSHG